MKTVKCLEGAAALRRRDALGGLAATAAIAGLGGSRAFAARFAADELAYMPASLQLELFRRRMLSPVDVLEAQIRRIEALNGTVHCITYKHFDEAMAAAKDSEARYARGDARPLEGVSVGVKDEHEAKGWRVTMGSLLLKDAPPGEEDGAIVDLLKSAGAVLHIQTTAPEFYLAPQTATRLWGVTRNPWNLHYSPGGSSGGSGAALAAGFATLATGSDMGGSIRIPAAQTGVFGFKPPFQRVASSEIAYESSGPMARTLTDMLLMQNVIAGPHPKVHATLRPKLEYPLAYPSVRGMKVAVDYARGMGPLDAEVEKSMDDTVSMLKELGCEVVVKDLGFKYEGDFQSWAKGLLSTSMGMLLEMAARDRDALTPYVRKFLDGYRGRLGPKEAGEADELLARTHRRVQQQVFTAGIQALVMPTMLTPYVPADWNMDSDKDFVIVNGEKYEGKWDFLATWVWNMLSRYPVMNVPVGMSKKRVPFGVQVIGNTFDDLIAMRLSAALEMVVPRFYSDDLMPDFRNAE